MKLIIATDSTEHSAAAVERLSSIGLSDGDEITILTVIDLALPVALAGSAVEGLSATDLEERYRETAERSLENARARITEMFPNVRIRISPEVLFGTPERRIVERAEEICADLIVVGSHGHNAWERLLLGSVSDSVVHHAPCSVLVVRRPRNDGSDH